MNGEPWWRPFVVCGPYECRGRWGVRGAAMRRRSRRLGLGAQAAGEGGGGGRGRGGNGEGGLRGGGGGVRRGGDGLGLTGGHGCVPSVFDAPIDRRGR